MAGNRGRRHQGDLLMEIVWIREEQEVWDPVSGKHGSRSRGVVEHPDEGRAQPRLR